MIKKSEKKRAKLNSLIEAFIKKVKKE